MLTLSLIQETELGILSAEEGLILRWLFGRLTAEVRGLVIGIFQFIIIYFWTLLLFIGFYKILGRLFWNCMHCSVAVHLLRHGQWTDDIVPGWFFDGLFLSEEGGTVLNWRRVCVVSVKFGIWLLIVSLPFFFIDIRQYKLVGDVLLVTVQINYSVLRSFGLWPNWDVLSYILSISGLDFLDQCQHLLGLPHSTFYFGWVWLLLYC